MSAPELREAPSEALPGRVRDGLRPDLVKGKCQLLSGSLLLDLLQRKKDKGQHALQD